MSCCSVHALTKLSYLTHCWLECLWCHMTSDPSFLTCKNMGNNSMFIFHFVLCCLLNAEPCPGETITIFPVYTSYTDYGKDQSQTQWGNIEHLNLILTFPLKALHSSNPPMTIQCSENSGPAFLALPFFTDHTYRRGTLSFFTMLRTIQNILKGKTLTV